MANTKSAAKALRQSIKKRQQNLTWKRSINDAKKTIKRMIDKKENDILKIRKQESVLQKLVDKAAKNKVIHKNKANRIKMRFSDKITAHEQKLQTKSKPADK